MSQLQPGVLVNVSQTPIAQSTTIPGEGLAAFAAAYNIGPVTPVQVNSWSQFTALFGSFAQSNGSLLHQSVYQFFANGGSSCFAVRIPNTDAVAAHITVPALDATIDTNPVLTITATTVGAWGNSVYVLITTAGAVVTPGGGNQQRFNLQVFYGGTAQSNLVETFPSVSVNPADSRYVVNVVNSVISGSKYITLVNNNTSYIAGTNDPAPNSTGTFYDLASGADGSAAPTMGTSVSAVYDTLQDQVLYLNIPGPLTQTDAGSLNTWATGRGDVMIVVDGPLPSSGETSATVASNYTSMVSGGSALPASSAIAVYGPYLYVQDPSSTITGAMRYVPPGGAVLAIWDKASKLYGIQQAPAGTWATVNASALETNFTASQLQTLRAAQVNPIVSKPNVGFCIFGANTLGANLPSQYVNIQRALIELTHDMENLCQFAVFQPNNANLWEAITSALTAYLTQQMQAGVLAGSTPATSFVVVCDDTINTPTSAQSGFVYATVAVALSSPAEFLVINLSLLSGSAGSTS
jgi:phage tail sheath protein FI